MSNFTVGDEVVVFYLKTPLQHNSLHSPKHPCRGVILKKGRKYYHVQSTGAAIQVLIDNSGTTRVYTVEEARELHRKNFGGPGEWRTAEFIEEVIAGL